MLMSDEFRLPKWYSIVIGHDGDGSVLNNICETALKNMSLCAAICGGESGSEWVAEAWGHDRAQRCVVIEMLKGTPGRPQAMSISEIKEVMGPLVGWIRERALSLHVQINYAYLIRREDAYVKVQSL
jgi:hypothetical protein